MSSSVESVSYNAVQSSTLVKVGASVAILLGVGATNLPMNKEISSSILVVKPAPAVVNPPKPVPGSPGKTGDVYSLRPKLGVNVAGVSYFGGEPVFANHLFGIRWLVPSAGWGNIADERLRPDGFPLMVDGSAAAPAVIAIMNPPMEAMTTANAVTRCTWQGTGKVNLGGSRKDLRWGDREVEFQWPQAIGNANRVMFEIARSDATDPIRGVDCRLKGDDSSALFASSLLTYLKPFGVLRFLDMSNGANGNPGSLTWANRTQPNDFVQRGPDGVAIETTLKLANANGSSPWYTIAWNADADYHRRMAQLVHDTLPAGRPVYVEVSNEVWNYSFGQARLAEQEGLARGLHTNGFSANLARYAQKVTEVMPIWEAVFKDRPKDLVRVAATQAANVWVGGQLFEWNNGAMAKHVDAVAIAPYFSIEPAKLTGNHDANMALLAAEAKRQIVVQSAQYKALADKWGKRLIAYEGGQHQLDPGRLDRMQAMNRDPRMEGIYRQYLADWNALTGDLFTLYSATGAISQFGAWGLREYAGQPLAETPKLRGVISRE